LHGVIGNQAVGRLLAGAVPSAGPPIQRRVGIEAEMTVPVTTDRDPKTADERVRNFLGYGASYNQEAQAKANGFRIKTDKSEIAGEVKNAREKFDEYIEAGNKGQKKKSQRKPIESNGKATAIMEYVSDPFDEETERAAFKSTVEAMTADMQTKLANAVQGLYEMGTYMYGIPEEDDFKKFATRNRVAERSAVLYRNAIAKRINDELYLQVTAGILPSKLPAHMRMAMRPQNREQSLGKVEELGLTSTQVLLVQRLLTRGAIDAAELAVARFGLPNRVDAQDKKGLEGYLSLVISYIFGNYVLGPLIGTVGKNMVPFLSKSPLNSVMTELDASVRPDQMSPKKRGKLIAQIIKQVEASVEAKDIRPLWRNDNEVLGAWRTKWLPDVLSGTEDWFTDRQLAACTVIPPEPHDASRNINRPASEGGGTKQEGVIPVEYRLIPEAVKIKPDALWPAVVKFLD
jgi:hypothetical protein